MLVAGRIARIARGSGHSKAEVEELLKAFKVILKGFNKGGLGKMIAKGGDMSQMNPRMLQRMMNPQMVKAMGGT